MLSPRTPLKHVLVPVYWVISVWRHVQPSSTKQIILHDILRPPLPSLGALALRGHFRPLDPTWSFGFVNWIKVSSPNPKWLVAFSLSSLTTVLHYITWYYGLQSWFILFDSWWYNSWLEYVCSLAWQVSSWDIGQDPNNELEQWVGTVRRNFIYRGLSLSHHTPDTRLLWLITPITWLEGKAAQQTHPVVSSSSCWHDAHTLRWHEELSHQIYHITTSSQSP